MKCCTKCLLNKDRSEFTLAKRMKDKLASWCKSCSLANTRKWRKDNPTNAKNSELKSQYGITLDQYDEMFTKQNGCCALCDRHQSQFVRKLAVDHDHVTGKIRKLLCSKCNTDLALVENKMNFIERAVVYLKEV